MQKDYKFIFRSEGTYLGFVSSDFIFSRDGVYLGWLEGEFVWDESGNFRGFVLEQDGHTYLVVDKFSVPPVPKSPRIEPHKNVLPDPPANISPISLPVGFADAF